MSQSEETKKKGRPPKRGLDWFPMETRSDLRLEALEAEHGNDGHAVYVKVLKEIYQTDAGELDISSAIIRLILSKRANVSESKWMQILESAVAVQLFDRHKFNEQILTSDEIRERFSLVENTRETARIRAEKRKPNTNNLGNCSPNNRTFSGEKSNREEKSILKKKNACASETPNGARALRPERRIFSRSNSDTNPLTNALLKKAGIS